MLRNNISKKVDEYKEVLNDAKIVTPKVENDKKPMENLHQSSPMVLKSPSQHKTKSPMKKFSENSKEIPMNNSINASDSKAQSAGKYTNNIFERKKSLQTNFFDIFFS